MKIVIISLIINFLANFYVALKIKTNHDNNEFIKEVLGKKKDHGHYEKYMKTEDTVVFIPGDKPSGIPGAFVVSNKEAQGIDPRKPELVDPSKKQ